MAAISMYSNSSAVNTLFSGLSKSKTGLESVISDYGTLKSGSYYKLSKAYYSDLKSGVSSSDNSSKKSDYTYYDYKNSKKTTGEYTYYDYATGKYVKSKDGKTVAAKDNAADDKTASSDKTAVKSADVIAAANDLMDTTAKLVSTGSSSVFRKDNITDKATGTTSYGYDKDKIYDSVSKFIDSYNKVIDTASKSDNSSVSSYLNSVKASTKSEEAFFSELGITADKETGKLSVDEEAFKKADMTTAKSLFNGTGSYAYQISSKASMINYYAANDTTSKGTTYASNGAVNSASYSAGDLLSAMV